MQKKPAKMQIKIDESVLRKTEIFRKILDDKNRRAGGAPALAEGLRFEYLPPVPREDKQALDSFGGLGVCLRGDYVDKHAWYKTPDLITGGFDSSTKSEVVYLAECKFNAGHPGNVLGKSSDFHKSIADKFKVVDLWKIHAPAKEFFVLFSHGNAEQAKYRLHQLQRASKGEEKDLMESFTICNLTEFKARFA